MKNRLVILSLLAALSIFDMDAAWQLPITNYTQQEYQAGTQTWQIKEQQNEWMYFANNYGLLEYDGVNWQIYGIWNSTTIRAIEIDGKGDIYVGGANEYGVFSPDNQGKMEYRPLSLDIDERYRDFGEVWNIHRMHDDLYIQTRNWFFRQGDNGTFDVIAPQSRIYCSSKIRDALFVATDDGIYILTGRQLNAIRGSELLHGLEIRSMQAYGAKSVLIATDFGGLFIFDGDVISPFTTEADRYIEENQLYSMAISDHTLAFGTVSGGVVLTDIDGKNPRYINKTNGLQNNTILSLCFDTNNNLWLGLDNGITKININSPVEQLYNNINYYGTGYHILIDEESHTAYYATNQGLYSSEWPIDNGGSNIQLNLIPNSLGQVWHLDRIGNTIFCSHNRGLFVVTPSGIQPIFTNEGCWAVRPLKGDDNMAIAGTYSGFNLLIRNNGVWRNAMKITGFDGTARVFDVDANNKIWIITQRGVERLTLTNNYTRCTPEVIQKATGDPKEYFGMHRIDDQLFISGTYKSMLINTQGMPAAPDPIQKNLNGPGAYSAVAKDEDANLWFIQNNTLYIRVYDKPNRRYLEKKQIFTSPYFFVGGFEKIIVIGDDRAIITGTSGFGLANNNTIAAKPASVYIHSIISTRNDSILYQQSWPTKDITPKIEYRYNDIKIEYNTSPTNNIERQYSTKLSPIDSEWSSYSSATNKEYTALGEGKYTFKVRTDGGTENSVTFIITPPWYRSWWSYLVWMAIILLAAYIVYLAIKKRIDKSKLSLIEKKNEEMKLLEQQHIEENHKKEKEIIRLQNERLEYDLKAKSQELANILLVHVDKNETLIDIKQELRKIAKEISDKDLDHANRHILLLQNKIQRNVEQNINWEQFEENFDIVNNNFIKNLVQQYPWLSKNERKLCVYIKMGLITKEIAPLLNMSVRGVEMLRYRLRKKMELEHDNNFTELFNSIETDQTTFDEK